jgi:hypothetical protein
MKKTLLFILLLIFSLTLNAQTKEYNFTFHNSIEKIDKYSFQNKNMFKPQDKYVIKDIPLTKLDLNLDKVSDKGKIIIPITCVMSSVIISSIIHDRIHNESVSKVRYAMSGMFVSVCFVMSINELKDAL